MYTYIYIYIYIRKIFRVNPCPPLWPQRVNPRQDARARCAWAGQEDSWWTARLRSICALERWRMQEMRVRHWSSG